MTQQDATPQTKPCPYCEKAMVRGRAAGLPVTTGNAPGPLVRRDRYESRFASADSPSQRCSLTGYMIHV